MIDNSDFKLFNSLGQLVKEFINVYEYDNSFTIDVSGIKNGIYFILIFNQNKILSQKIIINHLK